MDFLSVGLVFLLLSVATSVSGQFACGTYGITCIGMPLGCEATNESSCDALARVSSTDDDLVHVELTATSKGSLKLDLTARWIAVGFSPDGLMANSSVVHCISENGQSQSRLTYNSDQEYLNEGWSNITQSQLTALKNSVNEDSLSCTVNLVSKISIHDYIFDLSEIKHSLILATGPMVMGVIRKHELPTISSAPAAYEF